MSAPQEKKEEKKPAAEERRGGFVDNKPKKKKLDLMEVEIKKKKAEEDFGPVVEKAIPEHLALAKSGKPAEAIEHLYALEKQTRQVQFPLTTVHSLTPLPGGDAISTAKVATAIIDICHDNKDLKGVLNHLQVLSKRRGQLKQAITAIVQRAVKFVDELNTTTELEQKLELINVLRTITEGKIYVENERARLTKILANIKESAGNVKEASEILQEVQVETYGSMEKKEKTDFILEQTRLCLDSKDFVRGLIIARKINPKVLTEAGFDELKLKYYTLVIRYWANEKNFLEIAKAYQAIYDTPQVKASDALWKTNLKLLALYLVLAPFNNEQSDFINRVYLDKNLEEVPAFHRLLKTFLTKELMVWPRIQQLYHAELSALPPFAVPETSQTLWAAFQQRVTEHNIRVVAGYYSHITMDRLSQLLTLSKEESEKNLCDMVVNKSVWAKIDRPAGLVTFTPRKDPTDLLNEWSHGIGELLELVEKTCHLIHRENVVHHIK